MLGRYCVCVLLSVVRKSFISLNNYFGQLCAVILILTERLAPKSHLWPLAEKGFLFQRQSAG